MPGPLVTMVMPAWRPRQDWLLAAVESALAQRDCEVEVVVVDDGSPEPVANLLDGIADERLRVVRAEHGGVSSARNAGIAAARGDYLRFTDADDVYESGSTARLLALIGGRNDVIAYGATLMCDSDLRPLWKLTCRLEGDVAIPCLLGRFTVRPQSLLFPRRVVELAGGWDPDLTVSEDWDFVLRALDHARVRGDAAVATYYRRHGGGATADAKEGERGARRGVDPWLERHPEQRGTALERRARAMLLARTSRIRASRGQPRAAIMPALSSLRLDPRALGTELRQTAAPMRGRVGRVRARRAA